MGRQFTVARAARIGYAESLEIGAIWPVRIRKAKRVVLVTAVHAFGGNHQESLPVPRQVEFPDMVQARGVTGGSFLENFRPGRAFIVKMGVEKTPCHHLSHGGSVIGSGDISRIPLPPAEPFITHR